MKLDSLLKEYRDQVPNAPAIDFEALIQRESARKSRRRAAPNYLPRASARAPLAQTQSAADGTVDRLCRTGGNPNAPRTAASSVTADQRERGAARCTWSAGTQSGGQSKDDGGSTFGRRRYGSSRSRRGQ